MTIRCIVFGVPAHELVYYSCSRLQPKGKDEATEPYHRPPHRGMTKAQVCKWFGDSDGIRITSAAKLGLTSLIATAIASPSREPASGATSRIK